MVNRLTVDFWGWGRLTQSGVAIVRIPRGPIERQRQRQAFEKTGSGEAPKRASQLSDLFGPDALQENHRSNEIVGPIGLRVVLSSRMPGGPARRLYRPDGRHVAEAS